MQLCQFNSQNGLIAFLGLVFSIGSLGCSKGFSSSPSNPPQFISSTSEPTVTTPPEGSVGTPAASTPRTTNTPDTSLLAPPSTGGSGDYVYIPLVRNYSEGGGFKVIFAPTAQATSRWTNTSYNITSSTGDNGNLHFRFFVPPGTISIQSALLTRISSSVGVRVAAKFGSRPVSDVTDITAERAAQLDTSRVLQSLIRGDEVVYHTDPNAGGVRLASPPYGEVMTEVGGWVYVNVVEVPGNLISNIAVQIIVDKTCYDKWFTDPDTRWDSANNPAEEVQHTCTGGTSL